MRLAYRRCILLARQTRSFKSMAEMRDGKPYLSHLERTAAEPRDAGLHPVTLAGIDQINEGTRLLQLDIQEAERGISFQPGQWLDVFVPDDSVKKPGGFTVTSPPAFALPDRKHHNRNPFLELAVQYSPRNPPAAWLWQTPRQILGKTLNVRFGGSFVWPPPHCTTEPPKKVVMVAGGVGINPLMAMLSHLSQQYHNQWPCSASLLYACKPAHDAAAILFLPRLLALAPPLDLHIFFGDTSASVQLPSQIPSGISVNRRRLILDDVKARASPSLSDACFYICGPQKMTDEFVEGIKGFEDVSSENVLCEKWW